ncbi:FmdB family zinc ribbon protein [Methylocucumis oryzae]|uniref:FmdB family regulatory protein n=1 Tax=Methylocucumis oryzae TaxID=1632867 RepID=A0A0F3IMX2_9GAMM|nr:FmdB family zinc ribbon protein [Methylocucumis oryzae]KJV07898.1 FmdB family regulatory protein [Methylocucumis oryzae]
MPIYEYQCQACGHEHEALQKLNAEPLVICPACSQPELMKKISAAGFRLKGGGWYETDFKSGSKKNVAGEASSTPAASTPAAHSCSGACKNH